MARLLLALLAVLAAAPALAADPYAEWADTVIGKGVDVGGASAATVAIVADGKVVLVRGYGHADRKGGKPVDPARDRFQIASVSKTFAGLLLADLVQSGEMPTLETPANDVLTRLKLPASGGRPITLRHLASHSAGFEERGFAYFDQTRMQKPPSGADIRALLPAQVRPAGSAVVYANISAPLVATAIEDRTGRRYADLLAERLLGPLGMASTRLNARGEPSADLVQPFRPDGTVIPRHFNAPFFSPTGSIETTAPDMARYMLAVLGEGPTPLPATVRAAAIRPLGRNGPGLDSIGAFWFLGRWGDARTVEHAGGLSGVAATLVLVPERRLGLFVAWAAPAPPLGYGEIRDGFLATFVGAPGATRPVGGTDEGIEGRYWAERRPQTTAEQLFGLSAVTEVVRTPQGLAINGKPAVRIAPNLYEEQAAPGRAPARWLFQAGTLRERAGIARKVAGLADPQNQLWLALAGFALAASGLFAAIWARGRARALAPFAAVCALALPATVLALGGPEAIANLMQHGTDWPFRLGGFLTWLLLTAGLLLLFHGVRGPGRLPARLHVVAVGLGSLLLAGCLFHWRLPFPLHG